MDTPATTEAENATTEETTEIKYPVITTSDEDDGSVKTTSQVSADALVTWEKKYPDGKRVTYGNDGIEVTRFPKGNIEFILPKSKIKVEIAVGNGDDVLKSRRALASGGKSDEGMFFKSMYSHLGRFDGKFMVPEDIGRKIPFGDFLVLEQYFAEVNF